MGCDNSSEKNASHTDPVKKVDYLYEINYDSYSFDVAKDSLLKLPEGQFEGLAVIILYGLSGLQVAITKKVVHKDATYDKYKDLIPTRPNELFH